MYIRVAVWPGSKKEEVKKTKENYFEIRVKEPAERNLANKRLKEILAQEFEVSTGSVRLVSGHQSSRKIFSLPDEVTDNKKQ